MTYITLFEEGVSAWFSSFVWEDDSYKISVEDYLLERPKTTICVRVKGDSMIWAWIMRNDLVLVDTSINPKIWDIVIAIFDWVYTIKYLCTDKSWKTFLRSANKDYPDAYPKDSLSIFWVVVAVIRKYI